MSGKNWGKWYTSLDFSGKKRERDVSRETGTGFQVSGEHRRLPPQNSHPWGGEFTSGLSQGTRWLFTPIPGGEGRPSAEMPWRCALGSRSETRDTLARRGTPPPVRSYTASSAFTGSLTPPPTSPSGPTDSRLSGLQLLGLRGLNPVSWLRPQLPLPAPPTDRFPRQAPVGTARSALDSLPPPPTTPFRPHPHSTFLVWRLQGPHRVLCLRRQLPLTVQPTVCFPLDAHFGRTPTPLPPEIIQTPSWLSAPRNLCTRGQKKKKIPRPGSKPQARQARTSQRRPRWKSKWRRKGRGLNGPGGGHLKSVP